MESGLSVGTTEHLHYCVWGHSYSVCTVSGGVYHSEIKAFIFLESCFNKWIYSVWIITYANEHKISI
jgi:hypothetical protein